MSGLVQTYNDTSENQFDDILYIGPHHALKRHTNNWLYLTDVDLTHYESTYSNLGIYQIYCSGPMYKGSGSFLIDQPLPGKKDTHHYF